MGGSRVPRYNVGMATTVIFAGRADARSPAVLDGAADTSARVGTPLKVNGR
jgi:hypothetical protein